jgi:hypothetical protein
MEYNQMMKTIKDFHAKIAGDREKFAIYCLIQRLEDEMDEYLDKMFWSNATDEERKREKAVAKAHMKTMNFAHQMLNMPSKHEVEALEYETEEFWEKKNNE